MKKFRGALVGCGMISEFHLKGWRRIPEVDLVGLADPDQERAGQRRVQFYPEARVYPNLDQLLASETLDFLDIVSPPWLHKEHCLQAAAKGLHIICQKPLCDKIEDARDLTAALRSYPKFFCVHENHPYRPWFLRILELHKQNVFGPLRFLRLEQNDFERAFVDALIQSGSPPQPALENLKTLEITFAAYEAGLSPD